MHLLRFRLLPALSPIVVTFAVLAGCAHSPAPDDEPKPVVDRIAVLAVSSPSPDQVKTENASLVVGAGISWLDNRYKSGVFAEKMREASASSGRKLTSALIEQLSKQGFRPVLLEVPKGMAENEEGVDYGKLPTELPVLHVTINAMGMYSGKLSLHYLPRFNVSASLVEPKTEAYWFSEDFYYGADSRGEKYWSLPSDPKYRYPTFEALIADPAGMAEGFDLGIQAVAERIAQQFKQRFQETRGVAAAVPVAAAASAAQ